MSLSLFDRQVLDAIGDGESTLADVYGRMWKSVAIRSSVRKLISRGLVEDRRFAPGQTTNERHRATFRPARLALTDAGRADHTAWKAAA